MKVLHYLGYPLAWAKGGHTVQIMRTLEALERQGVVNAWLDPARLEAQTADVLHYWTRPPGDFHWQLARRQGFKLVISELHAVGAMRPRWQWPLRRWLAQGLRCGLGANLYGAFGAGIYPACDAAVAVTPAEAAYMRIVFGAPAEKTCCIPNGVDDVFFDQTIQPEPFAGLLYIGYICERKNSVAVARAARQALVPVKFVGGAPFGAHDSYVDEFKSLVDGRAVLWTGEVQQRERLAAMIRGAQGVLLASRSEASPLSILEALACRRPVLVSALRNLRAYYGSAICFCHQPDHPAFIGELQAFRTQCQNGLRQQVNVSRWTDVGLEYARIYQKITAGAAAADQAAQKRAPLL